MVDVRARRVLCISLTGVRVRGSHEERMAAEVLTLGSCRESDEEDRRAEPHPPPVK